MEFFVADTRFSHEKIIGYENRPFSSTEEMDRSLVDNWNRSVTNRDHVWSLGNMFWRRPKAREIIPELAGRKHLVRSKHDAKWLNRDLAAQFESVHNGYKLIECELFDVVASPYPIVHFCGQFFDDSIMLYGHVRNTVGERLTQIAQKRMLEAQGGQGGLMLNVGACMTYMDYAPQDLDYLVSVAEERRDFLLEHSEEFIMNSPFGFN